MDMYQKFERATGYDIKSFFQSYVDYVNEEYPLVVDYYQGGEMNGTSFDKLNKLIKETTLIEPLFTLYETILDDISMWDILDMFTEVQTKLNTIRNSDRWLRSSRLNRTNTIQLQKQLRTGETFEEVSFEIEDDEPEDDWTNIVVPQYIIEEEYEENEGSNNFFINLKNAGNNNIETLVDNLVEKNVMGKDFSTQFIFEGNDVKTVEYEESLEQALKIILESIAGCIPEYKDYGLPETFAGVTVNAIQYPIIFKALMNMFQRDGRWKSAELIGLKRQEDSIFMEVKATAITNKDYIINVPISK